MRLYNAIKGIFYEINENWYSTNYIEPSSTLVEYLNEYQNFKLTVTDETIDELSNFEDDFISLKNSCCSGSSSSISFENCTTQYTSYLIDSKKEIVYSEEELYEYKTEGDISINNSIKYNGCYFYFINNTIFIFNQSHKILDIFLVDNILTLRNPQIMINIYSLYQFQLILIILISQFSLFSL